MGKKKIIAVIDTETCPIAPMTKGEVDPRKMRVYDLGYIIGEKRGNVLCERSFVIADWFFDPRRYMDSAYYGEKLPQYRANYMTGGEWEIVSFADAYKQFRADCKEYGVSEAWAYNCRFDALTLNESTKDASRGFSRFFLPYGVKWFDIWKLAELITGTAGYNEWAHAHGYVSAAGIAKTGVETLTRYLFGDEEFCERHTALDDARHEWDIIQYLKYRHYATPKTWGQGFRAAMTYSKAHGYYVSKSKR